MRIIYTYHRNSNRSKSRYAWHHNDEIYKTYQELSFIFAKKNHPSTPIILKTNTEGWKFVKELNLPWDDVNICLDSFNNLESNFWPYIKTKSVFEEKPPFLHIDYDVILEKNILNVLKPYSVVYQSPENVLGNTYYETFIKTHKKKLEASFLGYNAGFVYINNNTDKVNKVLSDYFDKYSGFGEDEFTNGIGIEQFVIPNVLKKDNRLKFTTLAKINNSYRNLNENSSLLQKYNSTPYLHYPSLGYSHYLFTTKNQFLDKVQKILNDIKNKTICLN